MSDLYEGFILNNRYEIHEKIGEGGMSVVYRATDRDTLQVVAVKILKKEFCYDEEFIKRFKNEAMAAKKLSHPNIVAIYDMGSDEDIHYIVMEHIEGLSLDELIKAKKKLPWKNALNISAQILSAVDHAHSNNIIHRDIKPLNIMITVEGNVKLTDFGIARAVSSATKSASNDSAGSVHYLSPEQVRGGFVDERSDVYSIGITMYEMVTGSVPFDGDSHVMIALKHIDGKITPPSEVDPSVPHGISDLIVLATRKETNRRFQSAGEMYEMLLKVMKNPYISFLEEVEKQENISKLPNEAEDLDKLKDNSEGVLEFENEEEKKAHRKNILFQAITYSIAAIVSVMVVIFVISAYNSMKDSDELKPHTIYKMDSYVGMLYSNVKEELEKQGFIVERAEVSDGSYPEGYIVSQSFDKGAEIEAGQTIVLTVALEKDSIILEDYVGQNLDLVKRRLSLLGVEYDVKNLQSAEYEKNTVMRTSPGKDGVVKKGDKVILYYSDGNLDYDTVSVPNLKGKTLAEAKALLSKYGLSVSVVYPSPSSVVDNLIYNASPTVLPTANATVTPTAQIPLPTATADVITLNPVIPEPIPTVEVPTAEATEMVIPLENGSGALDFVPLTNENENEGILPTDDIDSSAEPTSLPTEEPSQDPALEPTDIPSAEPTQEPVITEEPTLNPTQIPTIVPTIEPIIEPSATPDIPHIYATDTVVYQYPAAGTEVTYGETVCLYFYEDIVDVLPRETIKFEYPEEENNKPQEEKPENDIITGEQGEIINKDDYCSIIVKAQINGLGKKVEEIIYKADSIEKKKFPIKIDVPVSFNGEPTKVFIYLGEVDGNSELVQVRYVYGD